MGYASGAQKDFELGLKREMLLKQEACLDKIDTTGNLLDKGFREPLALLRFQRTDEAAAREIGQIVADFLTILVHERIHVGLLAIGAK